MFGKVVRAAAILRVYVAVCFVMMMVVVMVMMMMMMATAFVRMG